MSLPLPSFGAMDFGFALAEPEGSAERWGLPMAPILGSTQTRRQWIEFPGLDGVAVQHLGSGGKPVVWDILMSFETTAELVKFEQELEEARNGPADIMTVHGLSYSRTVLDSFDQMGPLLPGDERWQVRKRYLLQFTVLNPMEVTEA